MTGVLKKFLYKDIHFVFHANVHANVHADVHVDVEIKALMLIAFPKLFINSAVAHC